MNKAIKSCLSALALSSVLPLMAQQYTCEYYWNHDPGVGMATQITGTADGVESGSSALTLTLDAQSARPGVNVLGVRSCIHGHWSPTVISYVFVPQAAATISTTTCEYWWDRDPGVGSGSQLKVETSGAGVIDLTLAADGLAPGVHVLGLRSCINGNWSPTVVNYVFVPQPADAISNATCEYWWDRDPGVGLGKQITVETNGVGAIDLTLAADSLAPGIHTLGLRSRINGLWSPTTYSAVFVKDEALNHIDKAEYFWGTDPGYGKGTPISITTGNVVVIDKLDIAFPSEPQESYTLTIRAHSQIGGWSASYIKEFVPVEPTALTLDATALSMRSLGATEQLTAKIEPENSWRTDLSWTSSDTKVATVDANGTVTSVGDGTATISVSLGETDLKAVCTVKVLDETRFPIGDANGSMDVTITDVATTVDYTLGGTPATFIYTAADVTKDTEISIADAVGTVNIVLGIDSDSQKRAPRHHVAASMSMIQSDDNINVILDNQTALSAIQFDLILPPGLTLRENTYPGTFRLSQRGDMSHVVDYRQMTEDTYRVVVYSTSSAAFAGNVGAVLSFSVDPVDGESEDMEVVLHDIRVVEACAAETLLPDCMLTVSDMSSIVAVDARPISVYVVDRMLYIVAPCDMQVQMSTVYGVSVMLEAHEGLNKYAIGQAGIYIVDGKKVVVK